VHGARKLHGAEPRHRRDGRAQSSHSAVEPPGASAEGAACAKAADLFLGVSDLGAAIDVWMAGMYHRRPMLDPQLERIGVGYARLADGMLTAALRFENAARRRGGPVAYPADRQTDVFARNALALLLATVSATAATAENDSQSANSIMMRVLGGRQTIALGMLHAQNGDDWASRFASPVAKPT
jgi:hypothetical protein